MTRTTGLKQAELDRILRSIFGVCEKRSACEREYRHPGKCKIKRIRKVAA